MKVKAKRNIKINKTLISRYICNRFEYSFVIYLREKEPKIHILRAKVKILGNTYTFALKLNIQLSSELNFSLNKRRQRLSKNLMRRLFSQLIYDARVRNKSIDFVDNNKSIVGKTYKKRNIWFAFILGSDFCVFINFS